MAFATPYQDQKIPKGLFSRGGQLACCHRALTLIELLLAMALTAMIILGVSALAKVGEETFRTAELAVENVQTWHTCLSQIDRTVSQCYANARFPGVFVVSRTVGNLAFPEVLVVWCPPSGRPADPQGMPRIGELVFFMPSLAAPNELREFRLPDSQVVAPDITNSQAWEAFVRDIRMASATSSVLLTDRIRCFTVGSELLSAVRFHLQMAPPLAEWANGNLNWESLSWPQGLFSPDSGQRRVWIHTEIQLAPSVQSRLFNAEHCQSFVGSLSFQYTLWKKDRGL